MLELQSEKVSEVKPSLSLYLFIDPGKLRHHFHIKKMSTSTQYTHNMYQNAVSVIFKSPRSHPVSIGYSLAMALYMLLVQY